MIKKLTKNIDLIHQIEKKYTKREFCNIEVGDSIKIKKTIQEGNKKRTQILDGVIISCNHSGINKTITVRKIIQNIGVERVYLINSPQILAIEILKKAKVRRSKLYYLRNKSGKATRLKQRFT